MAGWIPTPLDKLDTGSSNNSLGGTGNSAVSGKAANKTAYGSSYDTRDYAAYGSLGLGSGANLDVLSFMGQADKTDAQKNYLSALSAQKFEADQAALQRDWQENMSNSSYQRAVEDMQKAGINPALAYQQGGASTPSGAMASGKASSGSGDSPIMRAMSGLFNTAISTAGGVYGKYLGAKMSNSAASERLSKQLSSQMEQLAYKEEMQNKRQERQNNFSRDEHFNDYKYKNNPQWFYER